MDYPKADSNAIQNVRRTSKVYVAPNRAKPEYARKESSNSISSSTNSNSSVETNLSCNRMERRKSSISSILSDQQIIMPLIRYKPCLPISCQRVALRVTIVIAMVLVWLILIPPIGYAVYKEIAKSKPTPEVNVSLAEKLLSSLNLSDKNVDCPELYIFVPQNNSCKPKCGEWSGCGKIMFFVEKCLLIIIDCFGLLFGFFGLISWIAVYKEWKFIQFGILITAIMGLLLSPLFIALDVPGPKYLYCSNEEIAWDYVKSPEKIHIQIYAAILHYVSASFLMWLFLSLINISLTVYFPFSGHLKWNSSLYKLFAFEAAIGWGVPLLLVGGVFGIGEGYNLVNPIQHPTMNTNRGDFVTIHSLTLIYGACISTVLLIFYRTRIRTLQQQAKTTVRIPMSEIEKRFIAVSILYMSILFLRSVYSTWLGFGSDWEASYREYSACVTLESQFNATDYNNNSSSKVLDLLPLHLRDEVPVCTYTCIIPFRTTLLRLTWIIILSITTVRSALAFWYSMIARAFCCKRKSRKSGKGVCEVSRKTEVKA